MWVYKRVYFYCSHWATEIRKELMDSTHIHFVHASKRGCFRTYFNTRNLVTKFRRRKKLIMYEKSG